MLCVKLGTVDKFKEMLRASLGSGTVNRSKKNLNCVTALTYPFLRKLCCAVQESVAIVPDVIHGDRRFTIRGVMAEVGTCHSSCQMIFTECFGKRLPWCPMQCVVSALPFSWFPVYEYCIPWIWHRATFFCSRNLSSTLKRDRFVGIPAIIQSATQKPTVVPKEERNRNSSVV
jgi:hypothetical protein